MGKKKENRKPNKKVFNRLSEIMTKESLSQATIASAIGMSKASVNTYLKERYEGNIEEFEKKIVDFINIQEERSNDIAVLNHKITTECIKTHVFNRIVDTIRTVHVEREIGVIYGEAGIGKTTALKEYVRNHNNVILIESDHGFTARVLFNTLFKKLGLGNQPPFLLHDTSVEIIERLKGSESLIIIDEAEYLPYKALELIRRVYDKAGVPVLLVGLPRLMANIRGKKGDFQQLYSRIGISTSLDKLTPADVHSFIKKEFNTENTKLLKEFYSYSKANARHLTKLIKRAKSLLKINECELDSEIIEEAAKMLVI